MSIFKECTLYRGQGKILVNLAMAQYIQDQVYEDANSVITFPECAGETLSLCVTETYEELRDFISAAAAIRKSAPTGITAYVKDGEMQTSYGKDGAE